MSTIHSFEHKVIEVKPKLFRGSFLADLGDVLRREGQGGWELVNAVHSSPATPLLLFFKRPR
ncbi:MAG TPA: hypothetical protein VMR06_01615 [Dokdonella sp.]|uniref:hypothetical protein n=1 Tax=Dokdonella sp. TaxID=2291710 RepID=UPI002BFE9972|nr:hypothetical protein [Dokdonella sp.]HUD40674.1 hypothetical protein [Dokdonella sp.]